MPLMSDATTGSQVRHWLAEFARRNGCPSEPGISAGASPEDAWTVVARAWNITSEELATRVATQFHLKRAQLDTAEPKALSLVPESLARRCLVFPLRETNDQLVVATWYPADLDADQALGFSSGRTPVYELAIPGDIRHAIEAHYGPDRSVERLLDKVEGDLATEVRVVTQQGPEVVAARELESAPVVKLTSMIITEAVEKGASDIHLEPGGDGGVVRFRIDGVLRTYMHIPMPALNRVISRIKVMGKLDIADRLRPQDGRARVQVRDRTLDLRLSTVPTREAEKAVIRVLDPANSKKLDDLGIPLPEVTRFKRLLKHRDGIVVVTGPTGSGKTTTLYAALRETVTGEVNVMTVEDPVEYELPGMTQIQVEPKRGVTFAAALRSILRQDPNVIFVGEIRDLETAEVAVQAALTGHLVLATIHANDAVGAIGRFTDLGLEPGKIAETLRGALAQRLLRRVCRACAVPVTDPLTQTEQELVQHYGVRPVMRTGGCPACNKSGYRGRLPIMEVMTSGSWLVGRIHDDASVVDLQKAAIANGMRPLREVALDRVRSGETTLEEVERVLGGGDGGAAVATEQPHILVVDDDDVQRAVARSVLTSQGFRVTEAADGLAALERLQTSSDIQLVVLDLEMPRLGGVEVLDRIRKSVTTAGLPVIILTGSTSESTEIDLMERGADDYVRKPIVAARFVARVRAALRRGAG